MDKRSAVLLLSVLAAWTLFAGCAGMKRTANFPLAGTWTNSLGTVWMIKPDGGFEVDIDGDGRRDLWGSLALRADQITIHGTGGIMPKGCDRDAIYRYQLNGDTLTFTREKDTCSSRKRNLSKEWHRK